MEKQKIIEEMANDIPYLTLSRQVFVSMTEMKNVGWTLSEEDNKMIAEVLVKNGWIKPDKNSIVLTKEEYEELRQNLNKLRQSERANILAEIADGGTSCHWCEEENQKIGYEKGSKETAEKILKEVYFYASSKETINLLTRIKEIATREGVEIKE